MTVAHENKEKVYQMILQSQKQGISFDQIARQFNGDILVPYYTAQLIIEMRIRSIVKDLKSPILYVAVEPSDKAPVNELPGKVE